jgi:rhodanese-related sulfurtransferase
METMPRCTVTELSNLLARQADCQVIDVREYAEYETERIDGAKLVPLSALEQNAPAIDGTKPIYVMCRSGQRAAQAAQRLTQMGFKNPTVVEGGMLAWSAAGLPVEKGTSKVWSLERQVRFTAGLIVLIGVLLAVFVHPYFIALSGFIGAGLVFAAATDTCAMGMMLARMPWNQKPKSRAEAVCETAK